MVLRPCGRKGGYAEGMHPQAPYIASFRTNFLLFDLGYIMWCTWNHDSGRAFAFAGGGITILVGTEIMIAVLNKKERERQAAREGAGDRA
jgi:cytochrome c biogenesis protein CcdA